ncbi:MAG: peptidoglycan DD-metalloendopeptidase family protein [Chitinophagaceae bacterium]|nr:peptidoglycan DD-metalloendopeptidase family protein [Chitinophagaceae bacterium]
MLSSILQQHRGCFAPVIRHTQQPVVLDFSAANTRLTAGVFSDTERFSLWVNEELRRLGAGFGMGGYLENRAMYSRSGVFAQPQTEPRSLHLGIDIWGPAGTPVYAPLPGRLHSKGFHPELGNYGAVLIWQHTLQNVTFYTLYGHLCQADLQMAEGTRVDAGAVIGHFGPPAENGWWPPHLHLQVIANLQGYSGDYPGVCAPSQRNFFAANCPDPALLLKWD